MSHLGDELDQQRFDELTRSFGANKSRRAVLKGLVAGVTGGTLASGGDSSSNGSSRFPGFFPWLFPNQNHEQSPGCCPESTRRLCGSQCVDFKTDHDNCGGCGNHCGQCDVCVNGSCTPSSSTNGILCQGAGGNAGICASGTCVVCAGKICNDVCIDTSSDPSNCGDCGTVCRDCEACESGTCKPSDSTDNNSCKCAQGSGICDAGSCHC